MKEENIPISDVKIIQHVYQDDAEQFVTPTDFHDINFTACKLVASALGVDIIAPTNTGKMRTIFTHLKAIAEENALRLRKISLQNDWWLHDHGPIIGLYNHHTCALIRKRNRYYMIDCKTGQRQEVTATLAKAIQPEAYVLHPTLPQGSIGLVQLLKFTFSTLKQDALKFILFQLSASLLLLLIPILTGIIFDSVIPFSNYSLLVQYAILLVITGAVVSIFNFLQLIYLLRIRIKAQYKTQVAIWDRLLRMPLSFFNQYPPGDLSYRCGIINNIQQNLGDNVIFTIITSAMSITTLGLMLFIDIYLTITTIFLVMIVALVYLFITFGLLKQQRKTIHQETLLSGILLNFVNIISKIRLNYKERRAFQVWEKEYASKVRAKILINKYIDSLSVFSVGIWGLSTMLIYSLVVWRGTALSFGDFIIFNAAFIQFFSSILALVTISTESLEIIPLLNQAQPILTHRIETHKDRYKIELNEAHITINNLVFRYPHASKPLFIDFNLDVKPGSYIAIVGPSGSGKSSLFRLLLGLEKPESGEIKFNGIDINHIQLENLREQIGVIMHPTGLIPGTLFDNIRGKNHSLTRVEALQIAKKVGLRDLIKQLPMQLDTIITDGIQTLAGGEIQRINLARALSSNPSILLLDEATGALDNLTQVKIDQLLKQLTMTRIVITHRLSSIRFADVIYVLQDGRFVESGGYEELMAAQGVFYRYVVSEG